MREQFENLKKLDKYAKSLGITLYRIEYGVENDAHTYIISPFNISPQVREKYPDIKSYIECLKHGNKRNSCCQGQ